MPIGRVFSLAFDTFDTNCRYNGVFGVLGVFMQANGRRLVLRRSVILVAGGHGAAGTATCCRKHQDWCVFVLYFVSCFACVVAGCCRVVVVVLMFARYILHAYFWPALKEIQMKQEGAICANKTITHRVVVLQHNYPSKST